MQLRRFTADSTPAALGAVRLALGDDAIILANRKIGDQVEIIATGQMEDAQSLAEISLESVSRHNALASDPEAVARGSANLLSSESSTADAGSHTDTAIEELSATINAAETHARPLQLRPGAQAANAEPRLPLSTAQIPAQASTSTAGSDIQNEQTATEEEIESAELNSSGIADSEKGTALNAGVIRTEMQNLSTELNDSLRQQNQQLSEIIEEQSTMINQYFKGLEVNLWGNNSPNRRLHLQRLLTLGIGAELAVQLVERATPDQSLDDALRQSFSLLKSTLPIGSDKTFTVPGVTILSGPPGAGKTTTLMKIATQHVKEHGSDSIVIICADTRRIGAFEELQAYGRLLGIPTVHAHDSSELDSLLGAFTHKQLVLIDHTLPLDSDVVEIPQRLLKPANTDTVRQLLVVSATSQSATVDALITRHCDGRSMQCVLTHLDASARLGEMFNAIIRHHIPIAYWSDAASVQKPLQRADASVLIATAVAMSRRLLPSPDDEWLLSLIQPSDHLVSKPVFSPASSEVNVR